MKIKRRKPKKIIESESFDISKKVLFSHPKSRKYILGLVKEYDQSKKQLAKLEEVKRKFYK